MPKVSVIIPVYGVELYIERCSRSLFEQSLDDIEFLFIDDCTPDKSIEILNDVLKEYPSRKDQVIIHRMGKNCGQALVRKWGILNATGEYVIHCDSDDWVDINMYRMMYEKAVEENADIVVCDYVTTDGIDCSKDVVHYGCHTTNREAFINNMLLQKDSWSLCNKLCKRTLYCKENFRFPEGAMGEDMAMTFQLMLNCNTISYIPIPHYHYYINRFSISRCLDTNKIYIRFNQAIANVNIVKKVFEENSKPKMFENGLKSLMYMEKQLLFPLVGIKKYRRIWLNTFKEINWKVLFMTNVRWQDKLKFYAALFGVIL